MKNLQNARLCCGPGGLLYCPGIGAFPYNSGNARPLKERIDNVNSGLLTETQEIHNLVYQFPLMPFSDFMLGFTNDYLFVMREMFNNIHHEDSFEDITLGKVLEFIVHKKETIRSEEDRNTVNALIEAVSAPLMLHIYDNYNSLCIQSRPLPVLDPQIRRTRDLTSNSTWTYIAPTKAPSAVCESLTQRLERIYQSKDYIAQNAIQTRHLESADLTFQLLNNITIEQYYNCIYYAIALLQGPTNSDIIPDESGYLDDGVTYYPSHEPYWKVTAQSLAEHEKLWESLLTDKTAPQTIADYYYQREEYYFIQDVFHLILYPLAFISMCFDVNVEDYLFVEWSIRADLYMPDDELEEFLASRTKEEEEEGSEMDFQISYWQDLRDYVTSTKINIRKE